MKLFYNYVSKHKVEQLFPHQTIYLPFFLFKYCPISPNTSGLCKGLRFAKHHSFYIADGRQVFRTHPRC